MRKIAGPFLRAWPVLHYARLFNRDQLMGNLLIKMTSPAVLNHAWRCVRNDRGMWSKGVSTPSMQSDIVRHIGELAQALLDGSYRPQPMRCFEAAKADGGRRTLCASVVRDKLAQRAALTVLEPLGEAIFHPDSLGFRPRCTVGMALARVRERVRQGLIWVADADIRQCFDAIPQDAALERLQWLSKDRDLTQLVRRWLAAMPVEFLPLGKGLGLPQGMVLSPFLCNLYLHQFDLILERRGIAFVRFADDFVLLSGSEAAARQALEAAEQALRKLGLELHPAKTQVVRSGPRHRFLGGRLPDSRPRFVV